MVRARCALVALLSACGLADSPCPHGYRQDRVRDRCLPSRTADASAVTAEDDAEVDSASDLGDMDASTGSAAEAARDSTTPLGLDADPADAPTAPDATQDGAMFDSEAGFDATQEGGAVSCSPQDIASWRSAHLVPDMRVTIHNCRVTCDGEYECADTCLRQAAGVQGCAECTRAQTECAGPWCSYACLASRTDHICLSCLCQTDCVDLFSACAGADLGLCPPSLYGPEVPVEAPPLSAPALLLGKSLSGALLSARFDDATGMAGPDVSIPAFPAGEAQIVAWSVAGRELAFHYSVSCHTPPCTVRAYPVLDDGSFAAPVYAERWEAGLEDLEVFAASGSSYLAALRRLDNVSASARDLWLSRLDWSSNQSQPVRALDGRLPLQASGGKAFTLFEPFAIGGDTFLFLGAPATGEVRVLRVAPSAEGIALVDSGFLPSWTLGWDTVEAFKSGGEWYLLAYKSGNIPISDEPASTARIFRPSLDLEGKVKLGAALFEGRLPDQLTHIRSYVDGQGHAHLVLHSGETGRMDAYRLSAEPSQWIDDLAQPVYTRQRGHVSPWNVLEIVRSGRWDQ